MKSTKQNIDFDTFKLEIQANSAHNDGWTQQFYKDELKKVEAKTTANPSKLRGLIEKEPKIHSKRAEIAEYNPDALFADGFDDAICGFDAAGCCTIYDYTACLNILHKDMTPEEAHEYMEFNVVSAYVGDFTPIFMHSILPAPHDCT